MVQLVIIIGLLVTLEDARQAHKRNSLEQKNNSEACQVYCVFGPGFLWGNSKIVFKSLLTDFQKISRENGGILKGHLLQDLKVPSSNLNKDLKFIELEMMKDH